jgi:hypothetical protein
MRSASLQHSLGLAAGLLSLPLAAHAAFDGDFAITDAVTPAGFYTLDSFPGEEGITPFGNWSVGFFPSDCGTSYIDTTHAPASVTLGSGTPSGEGFFESQTVMIVEMPCDGFVSFTLNVCNNTVNGLAGLELVISGEVQYFLTDASFSGPFGFHLASGETLEFRSTSLSSGTGSHASNVSTISDFVFTASVIPEPATFGALLGLAALGFAGRRRRSESPLAA